jgi:hypothetical protein
VSIFSKRFSCRLRRWLKCAAAVRSTAERKFFPGYVLVRANLTDEAYHLIKNTPKVTGFLGSDNRPVPIPDSGSRAYPDGQVQEGVERPKSSVTFRDRRAASAFPTVLSRRSTARCSGSGRRALAPQGGSFDLRPRYAGRSGIWSGRKDLIMAGRLTGGVTSVTKWWEVR